MNPSFFCPHSYLTPVVHSGLLTAWVLSRAAFLRRPSPLQQMKYLGDNFDEREWTLQKHESENPFSI